MPPAKTGLGKITLDAFRARSYHFRNRAARLGRRHAHFEFGPRCVAQLDDRFPSFDWRGQWRCSGFSVLAGTDENEDGASGEQVQDLQIIGPRADVDFCGTAGAALSSGWRLK